MSKKQSAVCICSPNIEFVIPHVTRIIKTHTLGLKTIERLAEIGPGKFEVVKLIAEGASGYILHVRKGHTIFKLFLSVRDAHMFAGGSALNIAVGLKRLGVSSVLCGAFADPLQAPFARFILQEMQQQHIPVIGFERSTTPSTFVIPDAEQNDSTVLTFKPEYKVGPEDIAEIVNRIMDVQPEYIIASGTRIYELKLIGAVFHACKTAYRVLVPSASLLRLTRRPKTRRTYLSILSKTSLLQLNEQEVGALLRTPTNHVLLTLEQMSRIARRLRKRRSSASQVKVIVTQRDLGVVTLMKGVYSHCPAVIPRRVRDTAGAGDAFLTGYIWGRVHGLSHEQRLQAGTFLASQAITVFGGHVGMPDYDAMMKYMTPILTTP